MSEDNGNGRSGSGNGDTTSQNDQMRPAKNLKGLLKFCLEATKSEDAQGSSEAPEPMTEERRKWLEEALTSMTVSPAERMNACLSLIEGAEIDTEEGTEQQVQALTELLEWAEDLDIAADFIKINGLRIVPGLMSSEVSELRWRCLELLANISQNNPEGQHAILTLQLLPAILLLLDSDPHPTVRIKALYAISCLVRSNLKAQQQFLLADGMSVLVRGLQSPEEKLKIKSTFLISSLCTSDPVFKATLLQKGAVERLVDLLQTEEHGASHEQYMAALLSMVSASTKAQERCLQPVLDMKSFLCQRIRFLDGKEEFQEEKDHAEAILKILNSDTAGSPAKKSKHSMALALS